MNIHINKTNSFQKKFQSVGDGSRFCLHNKNKRDCKLCGGNRLCRSDFCHTRGIKHYNMYCLTCTVNLFPDIITKRNYKTKEKHVVDHITSHFPNLTLIADKQVENSCSKKRPDLLVDMGSHIRIMINLVFGMNFSVLFVIFC